MRISAWSSDVCSSGLACDEALARLDHFRNAKGGSSTAKIRDKMQRTMQNNCAVYRTGDVLKEGVGLIDEVYKLMPDIAVSDRSLVWNSDLVETLELDNQIGRASGRERVCQYV